MAVWLAVVFLVVVLLGLFLLYCFFRCRKSNTNNARPTAAAEATAVGRSVQAAVGRPTAVTLSAALGRAVRVAGSRPTTATTSVARPTTATASVGIEVQIAARSARIRDFTYEELSKATDSFSDKARIGTGSYGIVYKGQLPNSQLVAVKKLHQFTEEARKELSTEEYNIGSVRHANLVQLIGTCCEPQRLLIVFDFIENGTLDQHLFPSSSSSSTTPPRELLSWENRYKIALGLAAGLNYLHTGCTKCLIHRDIKPANVMLDANFNPKLGDFGLSRFTEHNQSMQSTARGGTLGYIAPEIFSHVKASPASDVYSFGMVLLQIVTGRKDFDVQVNEGKLLLVSWVWKLNYEGRVVDAVDQRLFTRRTQSYRYSSDEAKRLLRVGLRCCEWSPAQRPTMEDVKLMMEGKLSPIQVNPLEGDFKKALESKRMLPFHSQGANGISDHASTSTSTTYHTAASSLEHRTTGPPLPPKLPPARISESSHRRNHTGGRPVNQPPKPPPPHSKAAPSTH